MIKPSNVVVTVREARHLIIKAKDGVNKAYVTIELLKDKFVTDVEETLIPKWQTECSFPVTSEMFSNPKADIIVCVHHKRTGLYGLEPDEFLGQVCLPLGALNYADDTQRTQWYKLAGRKSTNKNRGEIELTIGFSFSSDASTVDDEKSKRRMKRIFDGVKDKLKPNRSPQSSRSALSARFLRSPRTPRLSRTSGTTINELEEKGPPVFPPRRSTDNSSSVFGTPGNSPKFRYPTPVGDEVFDWDGSPIRNPGHMFDSHNKHRRASARFERSEVPKSLKLSRKFDYGTGKSDYATTVHLRSSSMLDLGGADHQTWSDGSSTIDSPNKVAYLRNKLKLNFFTANILKKIVSSDRRPSSTIDEEIPENNNDPVLDSMSRGQLVQMVRDQQMQLKDKNVHIRELQDYIDTLLVRVMGRSPQLLEDFSCKTL